MNYFHLIFSFISSNFGLIIAIISWPQWPPSNERLDQNILIHCSSQDLFVHEQNSLSKWLDLFTIEQRELVPFERAKNCSVCSKQFHDWVFDYQQWHKNITTVLLFNQKSKTNDEQRNEVLKHDIRFLIYEKQLTGIADRFIHLISTYFVALLTKRLFIFDEDWPDFHEIFQLSLNSDHQAFAFLFEKFNFSKKVQSFSFDRYLKDYDYDQQFPERVLIFKGHTGGVIQTIDSKTSVYRKFLTEDLKMNTNNIFGCLYHSFFAYKLSEIVQRVALSSTKLNSFDHSSHEILQILLSPNFFTIGVQIRAGDATMQRKLTDQLLNDTQEKRLLGRVENYLNCTLDLIHQNQQSNVIPVVFLMSDSYEIRRSALKRWSLSLQSQSRLKNDRLYILSDSKPVLHIQYTNNRLLALQLGVFHMFLFSLCEQHLISTDSGFGRIPAFASLRQRNLYSLSLNERASC
ncbi:unnamed protein product [Adineta ricciae]|uniref:Uncharacterized protein n=2 Tax=Adineta ricciae TaxID=249248 RepID=A0A815DBT3_ADIRI|nr:unnamed protein product [Adineta ricciae]